jgi:predicted nucleic acid-binding Zn ribbon protein
MSAPADDALPPGRVGEVLDRVVRSLGGPSADALSALFEQWPDVVGERLAAHARPVSLRDGTLVVAVDEVGWATQLRFLEADLRRRLGDAAPGLRVDRVEVRVSPV